MSLSLHYITFCSYIANCTDRWLATENAFLQTFYVRLHEINPMKIKHLIVTNDLLSVWNRFLAFSFLANIYDTTISDIFKSAYIQHFGYFR